MLWRACPAQRADSSQLAAFWDGLDEGEKCAVMDLRTEHNGEHLMRQVRAVRTSPEPGGWTAVPAWLYGRALPCCSLACCLRFTEAARRLILMHAISPARALPVQLEIQKLHRQRSGAMDQLTQEQKRLHASGMLLHSACGGRGGAGGTPAAIQSLTGAHLMR